jgi:hypothetical protein
MTLLEILRLLRMKERESGCSLENALLLKRYREKSNIQILRPADAFYLPAVNAKARIKWGRFFIRAIFNFFGITTDEDGPHEPMFLVTIADKSHVTTDQPQQINLQRAVHQKAIEPGQFGYKLWYILKSPCKEYSLGKRRKPDERTGLARFKQNSRQLRPGHRVALFDLMRDMYLDELSMAGGEGCELLRRIKYEALREYRNKNGRGDRRP